MRNKLVEQGKYRVYEDGRVARIKKDGTEGNIATPKPNIYGTDAVVSVNYKSCSLKELLIDSFLAIGKEYEVICTDSPITVSNLREVVWGNGSEYEYKGKVGKVWSKHVVVFSNGEVLHTNTNTLTYGGNTGNGYRRVYVNKQQVLVHRMVAELFMPNPEDLATVNHINENKQDNRVSNLEWMSLEDNTKEYANLRENRLLKKLTLQAEELSKVRNELVEERKRLKVLVKELKAQESKTLQLEEEKKAVANLQNLAVMSHQTYIQRTKQTSKSNLVGKAVKVNGIKFPSISSAANYIASREAGKRMETIKKEIRKFVNGIRPEWKMYGKYYISM